MNSRLEDGTLERARTGDAPDARISRNSGRPPPGPTCYRKCSFISSTFHAGSFIKPPGQTHPARCISSQRDKEQRRDWRGFISMSKCQREAMSIRAPIRLFYRCLPRRGTSALEAPCFLPPVPLRWFIAASVCCQSRLPLGPPPGQPVYKARGRRRSASG